MSADHRRPSQKQRVLSLLRAAGLKGVRTNEFLAERLPRFSARLLELRHEGHLIEKRPDPQSASGMIYTLVGFTGAPQQERAPRPPTLEDRLNQLALQHGTVSLSVRKEPAAPDARFVVAFGDTEQKTCGPTLLSAIGYAEELSR